ncbi:MAG: hypothetical protein NVSMB65_10090 [Chloroflexota bacterium]
MINTILFLAIVAAAAGVVGGFEMAHAKTIMPGVQIGGIDVGGLTPAQAQARLQGLAAGLTKREIVLYGAGRSWHATPAQLGLRLDPAARVRQAVALGHEQDMGARMLTQADLILNGRSLPLVATYDRGMLHEYVMRLAVDVGRPVSSAALTLDTAAARARLVAPAQTGLRLDTAQTEGALAAALSDPAATRVALPVSELPPDISTQSARAEADAINRLLSTPYTLSGGGRTWRLAGPQLAAMIRLGTASVNGTTVYQHTVDDAALQALVSRLARDIDVLPREAAVMLRGDTVALSIGRTGRWLNTSAASAALATAIMGGGPHVIPLPVTQTTPRIAPAAARAEARRLAMLLDARIVLHVPAAHGTWPLSRHQIARMLTMTVVGREGGVAYQDAVNQTAVLSYVKDLARAAALPVHPPRVMLQGTRVVIVPTRLGLELDTQGAAQAVAAAVMTGGRHTVVLPSHAVGSPIPDQVAVAVAHQARRLLARPTTFAAGRYSWTLAPSQVAALLTVRETGSALGGGLLLDVDQTALGQALTAQAPLVERPARDARLVVAGDSVHVAPSQSGTQVDLARLAQMILQRAGEGPAIPVPTFLVNPRITTAQVQAMGIRSSIGSYVASFPGSAAPRLANIHVAVRHLDGTLIPPGQVFSFDKQIGQISPEEGYVQGIVIQGDKDVPGIGGGICQVADTLFKGAFYSGLPLVHWVNHQTLVPYYQPPGMDATVFVAPHSNADVQFRNDTGHWLMIKFTEDLANARLGVRFFGADLGTRTTVTGPWITYHPDGTADGVFHRTVTRNGKVVYDHTFHTHYKRPVA